MTEKITTPEALVDDMVVRDQFGDIGVVKAGCVHFPETAPIRVASAIRKYGPLTLLHPLPDAPAPSAEDRDALAALFAPALFSGRPDDEVGPATVAARDAERRRADAALSWLAARQPATSAEDREALDVIRAHAYSSRGLFCYDNREGRNGARCWWAPDPEQGDDYRDQHAQHLAAALAARQPAPVDAETTTEWGVRNPFGGHVETPGTEGEARALARRRRETLVYREVGPWRREVSRG